MWRLVGGDNSDDVCFCLVCSVIWFVAPFDLQIIVYLLVVYTHLLFTTPTCIYLTMSTCYLCTYIILIKHLLYCFPPSTLMPLPPFHPTKKERRIESLTLNKCCLLQSCIDLILVKLIDNSNATFTVVFMTTDFSKALASFKNCPVNNTIINKI